MLKEDSIFLAMIEDKIRQCQENYMVINTNFLDMRQQSMVERLCRNQKSFRLEFYGGYEEAERRTALFLPDYAELEDNNPLALLRLSHDGYKELTHRDYLGSLTGLGLKREVIGDILVRKDGADVIIMKEIQEFLQYNYGKAGRAYLEVELLPVENILVPDNRFEEKKDTVASLRLDNVVSSAFSMARGRAAEAITGGIVFVNGIQCDKTDKQVKEGDKLVLRGKGKVVLAQIGGSTRKDRIFITIKKYL